MRKMMMALAATSMTVPAVVVASPAEARQGYYQGRTWYDGNGRLRCKRRNGTTGLIVGAAGGGPEAQGRVPLTLRRSALLY